jgi:predicted nucleotidyltransferase
MVIPVTFSMRPSTVYEQHREAIRRVVERHHARNPRIFGSVLTGEDTEASDLDLLVDPTEEASILDIGAMRAALADLLGVRVDVPTPAAHPERWRTEVLREAHEV